MIGAINDTYFLLFLEARSRCWQIWFLLRVSYWFQDICCFTLSSHSFSSVHLGDWGNAGAISGVSSCSAGIMPLWSHLTLLPKDSKYNHVASSGFNIRILEVTVQAITVSLSSAGGLEPQSLERIIRSKIPCHRCEAKALKGLWYFSWVETPATGCYTNPFPYNLI